MASSKTSGGKTAAGKTSSDKNGGDKSTAAKNGSGGKSGGSRRSGGEAKGADSQAQAQSQSSTSSNDKPQEKPAPDQQDLQTARREHATLLILGASGDLTERLLLPGLGSLMRVEPDRDLTLLGSGRSPVGDEEFREKIRTAFTSVRTPESTIARITERAHYIQGDPTDAAALQGMLEQATGRVIIYFALPPAVTVKICEVLEGLDLPEGLRLAMEKPFGNDVDSARALNAQLQRVVPEDHIYRVDHFLATATVLNLVGLRFANRALQLMWDARQIERVEIVYDEPLALEGRAAYYDHAGALRDMLQSHLLQVLSLFAMEAPNSVDPTELHDLQAQVLRATHVWNDDPVASSRRARYTDGFVDGHQIPAYVEEEGVDPEVGTETLAEVTLEVKSNRWAGVPFTLRSGKALAQARKEIICYLRPVPHVPKGFRKIGDEPDRLVIGLKPGSVALDLSMNSASPLVLEQKKMETTLAGPEMTAYGEVLRHILDGNQLLAVRADIAEESWRVFESTLAAFASGEVPMDEYPAGSSGPWPIKRTH